MECPKCRDVKQLELFPVDRRRKDTPGIGTPCRKCQSASLKTWKQRVGYNRLRRNTQRLLRRGDKNRRRELLVWARSS